MKFIRYTIVFLISAVPLFGIAQAKFSPKDEALKQFYTMRPEIEKEEAGAMEEPNVVVGDINGDGLPDCIVSYILNQRDSGNMIAGSGHLIWLNTGSGMKAAGKFPAFKFCFSVKGIKAGAILIRKYTCERPYKDAAVLTKLVYKQGKVVELK